MSGREPDEATVDRIVGGIIDAYAYTLAPNDEDERRDAVARQVRAALAAIGSGAWRDARLAKIAEMCLAIGDRLKALGVVCNDLELVREISEGKRDPRTFALAASGSGAGRDAVIAAALAVQRAPQQCPSMIGPGPGTYCAAEGPPAASDLRERAERLIPDCYQRPKFVEAAVAEFAAIRAEGGCLKMKKATERALEILDARWPASEPISPRIRNLLGVLIDETIAIGRQDAADALKENCSAFDRDADD